MQCRNNLDLTSVVFCFAWRAYAEPCNQAGETSLELLGARHPIYRCQARKRDVRKVPPDPSALVFVYTERRCALRTRELQGRRLPLLALPWF